MARKLRIEYPGAIYHVINRGNYRRDVFESAGAAQSFRQTVMEACDTFRWRLHAYVVMRNHFHLAQLRRSGVPYLWLARTLRMGSANSVRAYVNRFQGKLHISP